MSVAELLKYYLSDVQVVISVTELLDFLFQFIYLFICLFVCVHAHVFQIFSHKKVAAHLFILTSLSVELYRYCNCYCRGGKQLCSHDVAYYSLRDTVDGFSELQSSVQKEANYDIFCIQSYNRKSFM